MKLLLAIVGSLLLLAVAAFCVFGFLATFEPGQFMAFRIGYKAPFQTASGFTGSPSELPSGPQDVGNEIIGILPARTRSQPAGPKSRVQGRWH